jgi:hypothetical protein
LTVYPLPPAADDEVFGQGTVWTTVHAYRPTRHAKRAVSASSLIETDISTECARRGFPIPRSV